VLDAFDAKFMRRYSGKVGFVTIYFATNGVPSPFCLSIRQGFSVKITETSARQ
jgi:hypothetical protein